MRDDVDEAIAITKTSMGGELGAFINDYAGRGINTEGAFDSSDREYVMKREASNRVKDQKKANDVRKELMKFKQAAVMNRNRGSEIQLGTAMAGKKKKDLLKVPALKLKRKKRKAPNNDGNRKSSCTRGSNIGNSTMADQKNKKVQEAGDPSKKMKPQSCTVDKAPETQGGGLAGLTAYSDSDSSDDSAD